MSLPSSYVERCKRVPRLGVQQNQGDSGLSYWGGLGAAIQGSRRQNGMTCELWL